MNEQQVRAIIQQEMKKGQYDVSKVPYHIHNGIDSPEITSSTASKAYAKIYNPALTSIAINNQGTSFEIGMQTTSLVSGVTVSTGGTFGIKTAGVYQVHFSVQAAMTGGAGVFTTFYNFVTKNGTQAVGSYCGAIGGSAVNGHALGLLNCSVGDVLDFWVENVTTNNAVNFSDASGLTTYAEIVQI